MRFVKEVVSETVSLLWRVYKYSKRYRVRQRAHCILLSVQGVTVPQLARMFNVSQQTVYNWLNAWEARRFPGLYDAPGKGRLYKLTESQKVQVKQWVKQFPKNLHTVIALVKEHFDIIVSKSTIKRVVKELKMRWRRIRRKPKKTPDSQEYHEKKEELKTLKTQEDEGKIALFFLMKPAFVSTQTFHTPGRKRGNLSRFRQAEVPA